MTFATLLPLIGVAGTVGPSLRVGTGAPTVNLQFDVGLNGMFSGTVLIEGSSAGNPGASDWVQVASVVFSAHTQNFSIDMISDMPWLRARMPVASLGAVSLFASV